MTGPAHRRSRLWLGTSPVVVLVVVAAAQVSFSRLHDDARPRTSAADRVGELAIAARDGPRADQDDPAARSCSRRRWMRHAGRRSARRFATAFVQLERGRVDGRTAARLLRAAAPALARQLLAEPARRPPATRMPPRRALVMRVAVLGPVGDAMKALVTLRGHDGRRVLELRLGREPDGWRVSAIEG
jgi:hypothetical protein